VDMSSMPDVAPTLMMLAPFLGQATRITGLGTLRVKECDRIAAPTRELRKLGVNVEEGPDFMVIEPLGEQAMSRRSVVEIETYHDHRIAMCFGVLGSRLPGLRILDPGCVAKTYPNFWKDWQRAAAAPRR
jgi:3-phosphoshikimate 1-carboxyvinyltransferase